MAIQKGLVKHSVFIHGYNSEMEIPTMVLSGSCVITLYNMINTIGIDPKFIYPASNQEELESFINDFAVIICEDFSPDINYIKSHKEYLFIGTDYLISSENFLHAVIIDDAMPYNIAEFTGITLMRNLRWEPTNKVWFLYGLATTLQKHSHMKLVARFSTEMAKWVAAGRPFRPEATVAMIWDKFCSKCSECILDEQNQNEGQCNICGCRIARESGKIRVFNKLAVATASCPMDVPRFRAMVDVTPEKIQGREKELHAMYVKEVSQWNGTLPKPCNCK